MTRKQDSTKTIETYILDQYSSEQEQIDKIKEWWKNNGKSLALGLSVALISIGGFRYWDSLRDKEAQEASLNYEQMLLMISDRNFTDAQTTGETIITAYPESIYAPMSSLILAKVAIDDNNLEQAKKLLSPLVDQGYDSRIKNIALSRLARIALAENKISEAKELISTFNKEKEDGRFSELKGDILAAEENFSEARSAYLTALASTANVSPGKEIIRLKLNNLPTNKDGDGS